MRALRAAPAIALLALALSAPAAPAASPSQGNFGVYGFDVDFAPPAGETALRAGSHPAAVTATLGFNPDEAEPQKPEGRLRDLAIEQVAGLVGDITAYKRCTSLEFLLDAPGSEQPSCPVASAVGITANSVTEIGEWVTSPVYNLAPPPGSPLRLGFAVLGQRLVIDVGIDTAYPYAAIATSHNTPQALDVFANLTRLWGNPSDPSHDSLRGLCASNINAASLEPEDLDFPFEPNPGCSLGVAPNPRPFLTLPTDCGGPLPSRFAATSWEGESDSGSALSHDEAGAPSPFRGCGALAAFDPEIGAAPTSRAAQSPTGLDFSLGIEDPGLTSVGGHAKSAIRKTVVTLPRGMTINPSQAEGLEVCSEADLGRETLAAAPGEGCPEASKVGTIEVESPLLGDAILKGSLYVAEPYRNLAGDSLIAVYVVIKDPGLGILIKQPIKVEPDPETGQLISTAAQMPPLPFSSFRLHFREGGRAPLISPPGCGRFETEAVLYPYSGGAPVTSSSSFQIVSGPNGSPCPAGAPFDPGFEAGTTNNAAGAYSPFAMRLTRQDGEQDLSRFSSVLPPGVLGRIAGIPWCGEAGIARARSRSGEHGGAAELADPSCPAASQVGRTVAGAGVGSQLTYVPGSLYLAGPYHGAPLSVVSITPAVAGPFDAGTVVVREALNLDPLTARVGVDGAASDPIPHILQGIPLSLRDLRVHADRPAFTLNATNCTPSLTLATLWGAGTALEPRGEVPVGRAARYQAAGCAALGFKPRLAVKLKGGTKRGAHPALRAVLTPRPGDANLSGAVVRLPHSAFLDQAHIRTVCTRVQFAAGPGHGAACPPGSVYGRATAWSPLLAAPLAGPVYLRSSDNKLPDLVLALRGQFQIDLGARIDSVKGGIRTIFSGVPDAPVSRFVLRMQGGKKGLIVNSKNLCRKQKRNRARASLRAQSGKRRTLRPVVRAVKCKRKGRGGHGKKKGKGGKGKRSSHRGAAAPRRSAAR
jgi:hypothetical protein